LTVKPQELTYIWVDQ